MNNTFAEDVRKGLSASQKRLNSKYFYDDRGSVLFEQIMALPEYYLTRAEMQIFSEKSDHLIQALQLNEDEPFEIMELGAGDGSKTIHLLMRLWERGFQFVYKPVDISNEAITQLRNLIDSLNVGFEVNYTVADYGDFESFMLPGEMPRVVLFLGSNLGNMSIGQSQAFLRGISSKLNTDDKLLLGLDLAKSGDIILPAYNDAAGITREFNLNLLMRINRELEANFDLAKFDHAPRYNEGLKRAESYLISLEPQEVYIEPLGKSFWFEEGEYIKTEISQKYDDGILDHILEHSQLSRIARITDNEQRFADFVLRKG